MKLTSLPIEFQQAIPVLERIQAANFLAYFVGGSVRDSLLNRPIHDIDIATSATPLEIKSIFRRTIDLGIEHGTVLVLEGDFGVEVTTFRTESDYQDYRRPSEVNFVRNLDEDLKRRDFTINALAMDKDGEILDLFNGVKDLDERVIRAVGNPKERFNEDALRILRAFRFSSVLGFEIDIETLEGIRETKHLLPNISVERIEMEFSKLLIGENYTHALQQMLDLTIDESFPVKITNGLYGLVNLKVPLSLKSGWTFLCYFNQLRGNEARAFLRAFKHSNQFVKEILTLLDGIMYRENNGWTIDTIYQYGFDNSILIEQMIGELGLENNYEIIHEIYNQLPIYQKSDLKINGKDILTASNCKQGKWLGELLNEIEHKVLYSELVNDKASLINFALKQIKQSETER